MEPQYYQADSTQIDQQVSTSCPSCYARNEADAAFCEVCGTTIDEQDAAATDGPAQPVPSSPASAPADDAAPEPATGQARSCPCGLEALPADASFCHRCGKPVGSESGLWLNYVDTDGQPHSIPMTAGESHIGKNGDNDIPLEDDPYVSRRHAKLTAANGEIQVQDIGSSNGTYFRLQGPTPLRPGDVLVIGKTVIEVSQTHSGGS
jgi:ribosomal protein L40E